MTHISSFHECVVPKWKRGDHRRRGGRDLCQFVATVRDGELRVMTGREPVGRQGNLLTHVSVSVGKPGVVGAFRCPTDGELEAVKQGLLSLLNFEEDNAGSKDPHVRHLWEIEE